MDKIQEKLFLPMPTQDAQTWQAHLSKELQRGWLEIATKVNNGLLNVIYQATEPIIADNTLALWVDSDDSKYYLVANFNGTQKKVELS